MAKATHLECSLCKQTHAPDQRCCTWSGACVSLCKQTHAPDQVQHLCSCGGPLLVRYDLDALRRTWKPAQVRQGPNSMWRYAPVLPPAETSVVTLGEGMTPLI